MAKVEMYAQLGTGKTFKPKVEVHAEAERLRTDSRNPAVKYQERDAAEYYQDREASVMLEAYEIVTEDATRMLYERTYTGTDGPLGFSTRPNHRRLGRLQSEVMRSIREFKHLDAENQSLRHMVHEKETALARISGDPEVILLKKVQAKLKEKYLNAEGILREFAEHLAVKDVEKNVQDFLKMQDPK